jgi:hypothetical protein
MLTSPIIAGISAPYKRRKIMSSVIHFKLVRSFSLGFTIHSPKLNGLSIEIYLGCFHLAFWNKGLKLFGYSNFWN